MAATVNRAGVTTIKVDAGDGLETLGQALDMPEIRDQGYWHDVPGDAHGGPQGPPIDIQFLGRTIGVRCEMSKYDATVAQKIRARINQVTTHYPGTVQAADIGRLMIQESKTFRVVLSNTNDPRNYPLCILREPEEIAVGTKFSTLILEFEAHRNQSTGVIYNTTIS